METGVSLAGNCNSLRRKPEFPGQETGVSKAGNYEETVIDYISYY